MEDLANCFDREFHAGVEIANLSERRNEISIERESGQVGRKLYGTASSLLIPD